MNTEANGEPEETVDQFIARMNEAQKEGMAIIARYKAGLAERKESAAKQKPVAPTFKEFEAFAHLADIPPSQVRMVRLKMRLRDIANKR